MDGLTSGFEDGFAPLHLLSFDIALFDRHPTAVYRTTGKTLTTEPHLHAIWIPGSGSFPVALPLSSPYCHRTPCGTLRTVYNEYKQPARPQPLTCPAARGHVADPLYLSLWFPSFSEQDMMEHVLAVLRQFPFSVARQGITYLAIHPVSWNEATVFERRFSPGVSPEEAVNMASDLLHEDYAYAFDANWDLWTPDSTGKQWTLAPSRVRLVVQGPEFEERTSEATGQIEVDFGLDTPFLQEQLQLDAETETRVRANVHKLVDFTNKVEKNTHANGRLLWSDSDDNLAQKLIARLQKVQ